ncbi:hypothetical protein OG453_44785 [Streptomyces sp. NBC_01381]|uniref:hypothetical protein n=1 Tax=Streptomyces sp. NBC_01381 TaxID=2903845 RepID=UPI0022583A89|nr:hypothetical protein [Streptomyces sp. NBC_01381]MCX4673676.1 hypothetical protein [Streptomyces sp. NBC_01381]
MVDPGLPAHVRKFLYKTSPSDLQSYGDPALPTRSALWDAVPYLIRAGVPLGAGTGLWWLLDKNADSTASAEYSSNMGAWHYMFSRAADLLGSILPLAAGVAGAWIVIGTMLAHDWTRIWKEVRTARDRFVLPSQLTEDASALLRRARTAARQVLGSEVLARDLIDRQHAELQLPAQFWDVARSLATYSRLIDETPSDVQSGEAAGLLKARKSALATGLGDLERQVEAIEAFAAQTAEADARLQELRQVEQLERDSGELLDFLASTARTEVAVDGLGQMSNEAAAVADRFTTALIAAKEAAVQALPAAPSRSSGSS